jgi:hypothetical protein
MGETNDKNYVEIENLYWRWCHEDLYIEFIPEMVMRIFECGINIKFLIGRVSSGHRYR